MIKNITKNTVLAKQLVKALSLKEKTFGLMLYSSPQAMLFQTRFGIHTYGMKYAIDIVVLDKNKKVVSMKENLRPKSFFFWNPFFSLIIELPKDTIKKSKTAIGDVLSFS